jgi:DNA-binding NarL/FixJ family response regulator
MSMTLLRKPVAVVADDAEFTGFLDPLLDHLGLDAFAVASGAAVLQAAREQQPALVVLDVRLPDISGFEICRELRDEFGDDLPIILVSAETTGNLDRAAGLLLGADDYLAKPVDPTLFVALVRRLVRRAHAMRRTDADPPPLDPGFTAREREILGLLADGNDRAAIASKLVISPRTVGSHVQHLLIKLGVHSQAQAVAAAYRQGLIAPAASPSVEPPTRN